ncbi:MAG TPA: DUF3332 family protein [Myxococcales bacterium]|jgi:hypothetical protein|nr:DUF3332 family protein [Myxococcales bacterium]
MTNFRRAVAIAVLLCFGQSSAACWGKFNLTRKLWGFNNTVSDSKWLKWLLFLAFTIVPIYEISALADALVLNSIEFWSGQNPVTANEVREDTRVVDGKTVHSVMTAEKLRIEIAEPGKELRVVEISAAGDGAVARDGAGKVLSQLAAGPDGEVVVSDAEGRPLFQRSGAEVEEIASAVQGGAPFLAVFESQEHGRRLASAR